MVLSYTCAEYPDRPNRTKFVKTLIRDNVNEDENDENGEVEKLLSPILKGELLNELLGDVDTELLKYERINWYNYSHYLGNNYRLFQSF